MTVKYKRITLCTDYYVGTDGSVKKRIFGNGQTIYEDVPISKTKNKYVIVALHHSGYTIRSTLHNMVLCTFRGEREKNQMARHLDGNKHNNKLSNLVYGSARDNARDTLKYMTYAPFSRVRVFRKHITYAGVRYVREEE